MSYYIYLILSRLSLRFIYCLWAIYGKHDNTQMRNPICVCQMMLEKIEKVNHLTPKLRIRFIFIISAKNTLRNSYQNYVFISQFYLKRNRKCSCYLAKITQFTITFHDSKYSIIVWIVKLTFRLYGYLL